MASPRSSQEATARRESQSTQETPVDSRDPYDIELEIQLSDHIYLLGYIFDEKDLEPEKNTMKLHETSIASIISILSLKREHLDNHLKSDKFKSNFETLLVVLRDIIELGMWDQDDSYLNRYQREPSPPATPRPGQNKSIKCWGMKDQAIRLRALLAANHNKPIDRDTFVSLVEILSLKTRLVPPKVVEATCICLLNIESTLERFKDAWSYSVLKLWPYLEHYVHNKDQSYNNLEMDEYVYKFPAAFVKLNHYDANHLHELDAAREALFRLAVKWLSRYSNYEKSMEDLRSKFTEARGEGSSLKNPTGSLASLLLIGNLLLASNKNEELLEFVNTDLIATMKISPKYIKFRLYLFLSELLKDIGISNSLFDKISTEIAKDLSSDDNRLNKSIKMCMDSVKVDTEIAQELRKLKIRVDWFCGIKNDLLSRSIGNVREYARSLKFDNIFDATLMSDIQPADFERIKTSILELDQLSMYMNMMHADESKIKTALEMIHNLVKRQQLRLGIDLEIRLLRIIMFVVPTRSIDYVSDLLITHACKYQACEVPWYLLTRLLDVCHYVETFGQRFEKRVKLINTLLGSILKYADSTASLFDPHLENIGLVYRYLKDHPGQYPVTFLKMIIMRWPRDASGFKANATFEVYLNRFIDLIITDLGRGSQERRFHLLAALVAALNVDYDSASSLIDMSQVVDPQPSPYPDLSRSSQYACEWLSKSIVLTYRSVFQDLASFDNLIDMMIATEALTVLWAVEGRAGQILRCELEQLGHDIDPKIRKMLFYNTPIQNDLINVSPYFSPINPRTARCPEPCPFPDTDTDMDEERAFESRLIEYMSL